jgi:FKBP-type peptidyl-prolyl cis-trans isomerase (trigger factor)
MSKPTSKSTQSVIARSEDGTIQLTFTIAFKKIDKTRKQVADELGKDITVPGFRRGKAPLNKLLDHIPENTLLEKTLAKILPKLVTKVIKTHKIKPAIYPKFELVKAREEEDWQIRATTAEIGKFSLGDYKRSVAGALRASKIWTPDTAKNLNAKESAKKLTRPEKEQRVIKTLLETINVKVPKMLIDEEVNSRLSKLLERLEKLGLNLESYLASIGKTAEKLREEYEKQASEAIKLDLILTKIADKESIKVEKKQIEEAIRASAVDKNLAKELDTPEKRKLIEVVLRKRAALNKLASLT